MYLEKCRSEIEGEVSKLYGELVVFIIVYLKWKVHCFPDAMHYYLYKGNIECLFFFFKKKVNHITIAFNSVTSWKKLQLNSLSLVRVLNHSHQHGRRHRWFLWQAVLLLHQHHLDLLQLLLLLLLRELVHQALHHHRHRDLLTQLIQVSQGMLLEYLCCCVIP